MMEYKSMGQIISDLRKKKGLTQKQLAEKLNVTDKAVSKWERDVARPDINTIPKLAEVLEISVEELMNIPAQQKGDAVPAKAQQKAETSKEDSVSADPVQAQYRSNVCRLLILGAIGFVCGFLFYVVTSLSDGNHISIWAAFAIGCTASGIPYGWELVGRMIGHWYVVGHIGIIILAGFLKLAGAILIGWIAYPVALLYNLIRAQKKGSKSRIIFFVLLAFFAVLVIVFFLITTKPESGRQQGVSKTTASMHEETGNDSMEVLFFDAAQLNVNDDIYLSVCGKALSYGVNEEQKDWESGHKILEEATLKGAYFLSCTDIDDPHYDFHAGTYMYNAVVVIAHYNVSIANTPPRDKWQVCFFPNFTNDDTGTFSYDAESEYYGEWLSDDFGELSATLRQEYDDMDFIALEIPVLNPNT